MEAPLITVGGGAALLFGIILIAVISATIFVALEKTIMFIDKSIRKLINKRK